MGTPLTKVIGPSEAEQVVGSDSAAAQPTHGLDFRKAFDRFAPLVWRALRHLGVREADIPDQCQEVFVVVHRRYHSFEGRSTFETWVYGICLRVASEYRRRAQFRREIVQEEIDLGGVEASQVDDVERQRARRKLQLLLASLDDAQREVFVLYEIEGLGMKQIAELMACPLQTAYSRLRLARAALLEVFQSTQGES